MITPRNALNILSAPSINFPVDVLEEAKQQTLPESCLVVTVPSECFVTGTILYESYQNDLNIKL